MILIELGHKLKCVLLRFYEINIHKGFYDCEIEEKGVDGNLLHRVKIIKHDYLSKRQLQYTDSIKDNLLKLEL